MFTVTITNPNDKDFKLELKTEDRKLLKPTLILLGENKLTGVVTEEVKPRTVKIKGVD